MNPFKNGAVAIAQLAAHETGERVDIIPAAVRYPRYPGAWITRWPPALQYAITFLAFPIFRRGATLNVGQPIDVRTLPVDPAEATRRVEAAVDALL